jgi:hypothetical protein
MSAICDGPDLAPSQPKRTSVAVRLTTGVGPEAERQALVAMPGKLPFVGLLLSSRMIQSRPLSYMKPPQNWTSVYAGGSSIRIA